MKSLEWKLEVNAANSTAVDSAPRSKEGTFEGSTGTLPGVKPVGQHKVPHSSRSLESKLKPPPVTPGNGRTGHCFHFLSATVNAHQLHVLSFLKHQRKELSRTKCKKAKAQCVSANTSPAIFVF